MSRSYSANKGFTLIEVIVVLAVVGILAAIMTPMITRYIDDAREARAKNDALIIGSGILALIKDAGRMPGDYAASGVKRLIGPGDQATGSGDAAAWGTGTTESLDDHLLANNPGGGTDYKTSGEFRWRGPYLESIKEDPWGNAYVVNAEYLKKTDKTNAVYVLSAGPDGVFQTVYTQSIEGPELGGDDIGYRIK